MAGREHALHMQHAAANNHPQSARMTSINLKPEFTEGQGPVVTFTKLNVEYFRTIPGWLKLAQLLIGVICLGCGSPALFGFARFYIFVASVSFICTALLTLAKLFSITISIPKVEWTFAEMIYTLVCCCLWVLAAVLELAIPTSNSFRIYGLLGEQFRNQYVVAGIFGLFQMITYGAGTFFLFVEWQASRPAPAPTSIPQS
ncbi:uncharacterized protein LOC100902304 [Galendromus occidentalis]|uniref:Uncharacterized protein LOC100902304 n=1 Tax=Galendromus occidentalis TaxID=34638 RepID=A0AAJ6QS44_9ACAR|nr:uncharacterized protein LOC100902304 [Galendromus occidentalis]